MAITAQGYRLIKTGPRTWRVEHRVVWEQHYGAIPKGHDVHHINGDKLDNRLENLRLLSAAEHLLHHTGAWRSRGKWQGTITCEHCGVQLVVGWRKKDRRFCGRSCAKKHDWQIAPGTQGRKKRIALAAA